MKRSHPGDSDGSDSDDDFGPMPLPAGTADASTTEDLSTDAAIAQSSSKAVTTKNVAKKLKHEKLYLENLPSSSMYEHSFMHRDIVTHIAVSKQTEFIITGSHDGHVKFWKKLPTNIEFVKHYHAHLGSISSFVLSNDGLKLVTVSSKDFMIKFFDVLSFDMSNMISASEYIPTLAIWLNGNSNPYLWSRVAVAERGSGKIRIYKTESSSSESPVLSIIDIHSAPVTSMALNQMYFTVVSVDTKGMVEYWNVDSFQPPTDKILFQHKIETDLYDLAKCKAVPYNVSISPNGLLFAIISSDKQIRIFSFLKGKFKRKYDESNQIYSSSSNSNFDAFELGRRLALEREYDNSLSHSHNSSSNSAACGMDGVYYSNNLCVFDDSSSFLIYGTMAGIKLLNVVTNKVSRILGQAESGERFVSLALYQGVPRIDTQFLLAKNDGTSMKTVEQMSARPVADPSIYTTSFKRRRFYCFSSREADESIEPRDTLNEKPTAEEKDTITEMVSRATSSEAIIRTTLGDIHLKLFAAECPRTIENFVTHARNKYYDNVLFHRVIKGFMLQTGDPLGDGTGGESIWGKEFADEFNRSLKHDRPYTVSMANAGPNTNGSQFFITTVPTPWLDNKHTVFGRATKGFDVIAKIESAKVNKYDKPHDLIKILTIDVL